MKTVRERAAELPTGIPPGAPVVLQAHDPDNFGEAIGAEVNLLLAGHTHGGHPISWD